MAPRRHSRPGKYCTASQRLKAPVPSSSEAGIHATVRGTSWIFWARLPAVVTTASLSSLFTPSSMEFCPASGSSGPRGAMLAGCCIGPPAGPPKREDDGVLEGSAGLAARPPGAGVAGELTEEPGAEAGAVTGAGAGVCSAGGGMGRLSGSLLLLVLGGGAAGSSGGGEAVGSSVDSPSMGAGVGAGAG